MYEVTDARTGDRLSKHRTRRAAVDTWRQDHTKKNVQIHRVDADGTRTLIVEGIWHEARRYDG